MKTFTIQNNIGCAKYVVNFHDGKKKHKDGSNFFDIAIFKSKKGLTNCIKGLRLQGYVKS